jgi:cyanate permease
MKKEMNRKDKFIQFLQFSKEVISLNENKLYLMAFGLLKAIMYGVLLWMPTYLKHRGAKVSQPTLQSSLMHAQSLAQEF